MRVDLVLNPRQFSLEEVQELFPDLQTLLRQHGVVPPDLGRQLEAMAGMRNVLVHLYWDIDYTLLYEVITTRSGAFEQVLDHLFRYLQSREA